jgi:hypothetical protein
MKTFILSGKYYNGDSYSETVKGIFHLQETMQELLKSEREYADGAIESDQAISTQSVEIETE